MSILVQDLRAAVRGLLRSPGLALALILTLALGIGLNTAMFSLIESILLRPLPYPGAERLVRIWAVNPRTGSDRDNLNPLDFSDLRQRARSFSDLAGITRPWVTVAGDRQGGGEPERVPGALVSSGFFRTLGASAALGRTFDPADERPEAPPVAVLGWEIWSRRFQADPGAVGRTALLNDAPALVIGVLPRSFRPPSAVAGGSPGEAPQIYRPLVIRQAMGRGGHWLPAIGRLAPGVDPRRAQAEMDLLARGLEELHTAGDAGWRIRLQGLHEATVGEIRKPLLLLSSGAWLLLLIACVNTANLLLVRAAARRSETDVRIALGARVRHLISRSLTESFLLAVAGAFAGLALAWAALRILPHVASSLPRIDEVALDGRTLAYTSGITLLTTLLFGLAPAWRAAGGRASRGRPLGGRPGFGRRLPAALVVAELALALVLLVGSALLLASFGRLVTVDPGFRAEGLLAATIELPESRYPEPFQASAFFAELRDRTAAQPGVESAAAVDILPFSGGYSCNSFAAEAPGAAGIPCIEYRAVTSSYFHTLETGFALGRDFTAADAAGAHPVALVNETLARALWPGRSALGRTITLDFERETPHTIIGVVHDVHQLGFATPAAPEVYVSILQHPASEMTLVVRTRRSPEAVAGAVRAAVRSLDRQLPVSRTAALEDLLAASVAPPRLRMLLLSLFAGLALALAAVGVSGVISAAVARRRQEIGLRMAIGADRGTVLRLILGQTLAYTAAGLALGLVAAVPAARLLGSLLFGVSPAEPRVFVASAALLALVALLAGYLPAERASRLEPLAAMNEE